MVDINNRAGYSTVRRAIFGKNNNDLAVFPNPAKDKATLMLDAKDGDQLTVRIFDAAGRMIKQQVVNIKNQQADIRLEGVTRGVHAVIAITEDGEHHKTKLMIGQ